MMGPTVSGSKSGLKRKRESRQEDDESRLTRKLHHVVKEVKQVGKKTKTFELQKQVKRLKALRQKEEEPDEVKLAEAQLSALKDLNTDNLACHALHTKVKKDRVLATNETVMAAMALSSSSFSPAIPKTPLAIIHSRLLSSKLLANETAKLVNEIRAIIQPPTPIPLPEEDGANDENQPAKLSSAQRAEVASIASDNEQEEEDGWESGSVHSQEPEHENVGYFDEAEEDEGTTLDASPQPSDLEEEDRMSSDEENSTKPTPKKAKVGKAVALGTSTFLPSLAVGFTRGDSDSEWSDSEAKFADGGRKNRRGQRARRAIWEKKYGRNAAHVKKQRELQAEERRRKPMAPPVDHGWGKRGPQQPAQGTQAQSRPHTHVSGSGRVAYRPAVQDKNHKLAPAQKSQQSRPLHPSWEAKRKQAEKNKAGIVRATGTKIKFTD